MKVKTKTNLIYAGNIYEANSEIEMDDVTARVNAHRGSVEIIGGTVETEIENAEVVELPPLEVKKKK